MPDPIVVDFGIFVKRPRYISHAAHASVMSPYIVPGHLQQPVHAEADTEHSHQHQADIVTSQLQWTLRP